MYKYLFPLFIFLIIAFNSLTSVYAAEQFQVKNPNQFGVQVIGGDKVGLTVQAIIGNTVTLFYLVGGIGVVVYFLWGAVEWIFSGGDKEKVASARRRMVHALIGLTLLALTFVILNVVGRILNFEPLGVLKIPQLGEEVK